MKLHQRMNRTLFVVGMSLPLLALVAMSWLVHQTSGQFQNSFYQVARSYKVMNAVQQTQFHLLDAETERRGYLLTAGDDYLVSYGRAMASVEQDIARLQNLDHDSAVQQTNIMELQQLISRDLRIDPRLLTEDRTNLHDALAIALTAQGKATMEQIGRVLFRMSQDQEAVLNASQQRAEADSLSSQITSVVLMVAVAMVLIFIVIILLRLEKLQKIITVCAWTGRVRFQGQWLRLDEYLQQQFGLSVSHSLSQEAAEKMMLEIEALNPGAHRPGDRTPPGA
jgi:CHASE3 domain sensor protein